MFTKANSEYSRKNALMIFDLHFFPNSMSERGSVFVDLNREPYEQLHNLNNQFEHNKDHGNHNEDHSNHYEDAKDNNHFEDLYHSYHDVHQTHSNDTPCTRMNSFLDSQPQKPLPPQRDDDFNTYTKLQFDFNTLESNLGTIKPRLYIENVVSGVNLGTRLNKHILKRLKGAYTKDGFVATIYKRTNARGEATSTALIFESGKLVVNGCRSEAESYTETLAHICAIQEVYEESNEQLYISPKINGSYVIDNVVASGTTSFPISLQSLVANEPRYCIYDPERFAGARYRLEKYEMTALVFAGGKIVLTGGKSVKTVRKAFDCLVGILRKYETLLLVRQKKRDRPVFIVPGGPGGPCGPIHGATTTTTTIAGVLETPQSPQPQSQTKKLKAKKIN